MLAIHTCEMVVAKMEGKLAYVGEDAVVDERPDYVHRAHRDNLDGAAEFTGCDVVAKEVDGVVEDEEGW